MKDIFGRWREYSKEKKTIKKLRLFDFDETIAYTQANVRVEEPGEIKQITLKDQKEFDIYAKRKAIEHSIKSHDPVPVLEGLGYKFDFSDFSVVHRPEENKMITKIIRDIIEANKKDPIREIYVITARRDSARGPIENYLHDLGFSVSGFTEIITLQGASKREKIEEIIAKHTDKNGRTTIESIHFFDDSMKNLEDVKQLKERYPQIEEIKIKQVVRGDIHTIKEQPSLTNH